MPLGKCVTHDRWVEQCRLVLICNHAISAKLLTGRRSGHRISGNSCPLSYWPPRLGDRREPSLGISQFLLISLSGVTGTA